MMDKKYTHEHQLQADCVIWFAEKYPTMRGSLWGNFTEQGVANAGKKLSLGLVKDLPDIMFRFGYIFGGIELKLPGTRHSVEHLLGQARWLAYRTDCGYFCDSLSGFKYIIETILATQDPVDINNVIKLNMENSRSIVNPLLIINYCTSIKTKTTTWDKEKFTKFAK